MNRNQEIEVLIQLMKDTRHNMRHRCGTKYRAIRAGNAVNTLTGTPAYVVVYRMDVLLEIYRAQYAMLTAKLKTLLEKI